MLIKPIVTEQTVAEMAKSRYTFKVQPFDTKTEIKKIVEKLFKVNVVSVHTANVHGKTYRSGKRWIVRQRSDWKKATVTLKPGQKIDIADVPGAEGK